MTDIQMIADYGDLCGEEGFWLWDMVSDPILLAKETEKFFSGPANDQNC